MNTFTAIDELRDYILEQHGMGKLADTIRSWPETTKPLVVYRGHGQSETIRASRLYSCSKEIDVAHSEFAGRGCCIFKIHVAPGIGHLDVNTFLGTEHAKADEHEIILAGGWKFYSDAKLTTLGVTPIKPYKGKNCFETWYAPAREAVNANTLFSRVLDEDWDLWKVSGSSVAEVEKNIRATLRDGETAPANLNSKIQARLGLSGGGRKRTRKLRRGRK